MERYKKIDLTAKYASVVVFHQLTDKDEYREYVIHMGTVYATMFGNNYAEIASGVLFHGKLIQHWFSISDQKSINDVTRMLNNVFDIRLSDFTNIQQQPEHTFMTEFGKHINKLIVGTTIE